MMKLIVGLVLFLVVVITRRGGGSLPRRYLGLVLVGMGALIWAGLFDALGAGRSVVSDTVLYRRVLVWSAIGILVSVAGVIASFRYSEKTLKISAVLIGAVAAVMCAINILVPY